jgi:hypothetical protein
VEELRDYFLEKEEKEEAEAVGRKSADSGKEAES